MHDRHICHPSSLARSSSSSKCSCRTETSHCCRAASTRGSLQSCRRTDHAAILPSSPQVDILPPRSTAARHDQHGGRDQILPRRYRGRRRGCSLRLVLSDPEGPGCLSWLCDYPHHERASAADMNCEFSTVIRAGPTPRTTALHERISGLPNGWYECSEICGTWRFGDGHTGVTDEGSVR